ncbi:MAG: SpoIIE family protein phosphatase [Bacteroidales bacterium]|nr:SpoIIE family protein phosphatase [Bacteroidales bacterium]
MIKKNLILCLLVISFISLHAQINTNGIPLIKNYTSSDYSAAEQNWAICEDDRGVIYVGNNDNGVMEFDGSKWKKIPISNNSIIRSLAYSEGTVYVGGVEEFGYLAPDINGEMKYHTLTDQLDTIDFQNVWKIIAVENDIYFCCYNDIFKFKNRKFVKKYKNKVDLSFLSFNINNKIYWGNINEGLFEIKNDSVVHALGGEFYKEIDIFIMLPWNEKEILIATMGQGNYIYNPQTGLSKSVASLGPKYKELNDLLDESQSYNGIRLSNGNYAFATLNNGCIIFNSEGEIIYKLDKNNGLLDNTVINLFESRDRNLWLGLNTGVSFIELNTPFTLFDQKYGFEGIVTDVIRFNGVLFVSTNTGVYYLSFNEDEIPEFKKIPINVKANTVWQMVICTDSETGKEKLLFATDYGVWEYKHGKDPEDLTPDKPYESEVIYQSKFNPERLFIGYGSGIALLEFKNGKIYDKDKFSNISEKVTSITEDDEGNIWVGTDLKGIIKLRPDLTYTNYGVEEGLPDLAKNDVYSINNDIIIITQKGLFYYNSKTDKFEKYKGFGEKYYSSDHEIRSIFFEKSNEYYVILVNPGTNLEYIEKVSISQDRIITVNDIPFKRLHGNAFQEIAFEGENDIWIAASDAIYNYKENLEDSFTNYYYSIIRQTEIGIDSVIFSGTFYDDTSSLKVTLKQPDELNKVVDFKDNSFSFYYSSPFFPTDEVKYSYMLEGYEREWSAWSPKNEKEYTNLNKGSYSFKVKAKNIYGFESEVAEFEFTIKPPWYQTVIAYLFYFILAIVVVYIIVKVYTRRLELEKIRLEQIVKERTEEVVKQKDEIADKNRSITDSIEYAKRIQTAILPSQELVEEILPEHFILFRPRDIVSGDFYWMAKKENLLVIIAADCTGHGVPGAFMSMLGVSFLNEIVNTNEVTTANVILNNLRADIKKTLGQEGKEGEAKDGMDIALCIVDFDNLKMQYAGAYNPLYIYRDNELMEIKADRMPIGIWVKEKESFTNNDIDLKKGDVFYIFSDGFQDQFGGEDGQKYKTKNYKKLLLEIHQKPMAEQREILDTTVDKWRGKWEQVDDIIIVGIRV